MSRILLIALLAMAGALAMVGTATADIGDIDAGELSDGDLESDDDSITVEGNITCEEDTVEYGVIAKVANEEPNSMLVDGDDDIAGEGGDFGDNEVEGVGAFGPAFEGVQDDQPCDENGQDFDVTVAANDGSEEFDSGDDLDVATLIGTSADDGAQGPGPIVGDIEFIAENDVEVE